MSDKEEHSQVKVNISPKQSSMSASRLGPQIPTLEDITNVILA